jgi:hypothetical protein
VTLLDRAVESLGDNRGRRSSASVQNRGTTIALSSLLGGSV